MTPLTILSYTTREDWKQAGAWLVFVGAMFIIGGIWL